MSGAMDRRARRARIAQLNDRARRAMGVACIAVATEGFRALPEDDQSRVRELVETFTAFDEGNNPYGEHDFGAVFQHVDGRWTTARPGGPEDERAQVFWKFEYYDHNLEFGSKDAANPLVTQRVLTIMLASEY